MKNQNTFRSREPAAPHSDMKTSVRSSGAISGILSRRRTSARSTGAISGILSRGVMTLEASFLIPWAVILSALLMVVCFYCTNTSYYRSAALEASLSGNQYTAGSGSAGHLALPSSSDPAGAGLASMSADFRIRDQAMPGTAPERSVECTSGGTEVRFAGQEYPVFRGVFSLDAGGSAKKVRPVPILRAAYALREAAGEWEGR